MNATVRNIAYTIAVSAIAAMTGLATDEAFTRLTPMSLISGALFILLWVGLAFDEGRVPNRCVRWVLLLYWAGLPTLILSLDLMARVTRVGAGFLAQVRRVADALLFSANYPITWLCVSILDVHPWWGAAAVGLTIVGARVWGDTWPRRGIRTRQ